MAVIITGVGLNIYTEPQIHSRWDEFTGVGDLYGVFSFH